MHFRLRDFKANIFIEDTGCTTTLWKKEVHQEQLLNVDYGMEPLLIHSTASTPTDSTAATVGGTVSSQLIKSNRVQKLVRQE